MLQEHWNDSTWANYEKRTYEYDSNGNKIMESHGYWHNSRWLNLKTHYVYNGNGFLVSTYSSAIKRIPNPLYGNPNQPRAIKIAVDSCYKHSYSYDNNDNRILELSETWKDSTWINARKTSYAYNNDGNVIIKLFKHWQDSTHTNQGLAWINSARTTYTYNNNGNMILTLHEKWENSTWINRSRITYTYDNNENIIIKLRERLQDSTWINSYKTTYTFNSNGNRISTLNERWQDSTWTNSNRTTYTYDSNGNMTLMLYEFWDGSTWINLNSSKHGEGSFSFRDAIGNYYSFKGKKVEVFYKKIADVNEKNNDNLLNYSLSQNYPNPFNPTTEMGFSIPVSSMTTLAIYNVLGQKIATLVNEKLSAGSYKYPFDAGNLTSGIYFYKLESNNYLEVKKMVLIK